HHHHHHSSGLVPRGSGMKETAAAKFERQHMDSPDLGTDDDDKTGGGRADPAHRSPVPLPSPTSNKQDISEANLAYLWPLTVDHGTIECLPSDNAVFVAPDGTTYALNDRAEKAGHPPITPIRAKGSGGGYISLGALLSTTLNLCGKG
uniref:Putative lipoprotein n=1 Tax=Microbispora sp. ATCC PTA-5024 TaxID=316330 RepID=UPI00065F2706|nr:Chain A, Putative lipoprotein [Microbispora sp. ATCC PTA-5024]6QFP_A Chain A, Putative lipoprotein [Microbispora sp. ATCC PTA-5024]